MFGSSFFFFFGQSMFGSSVVSVYKANFKSWTYVKPNGPKIIILGLKEIQVIRNLVSNQPKMTVEPLDNEKHVVKFKHKGTISHALESNKIRNK